MSDQYCFVDRSPVRARWLREPGPAALKHVAARRHSQVREWTHQDSAGGANARAEEDVHQMDEFLSSEGESRKPSEVH